jgi:hypothetical protein
VSPGVLKIKKISWLNRQLLRRRGRALGRDLAGYLAAWNQELRSPERILEALGLAEADLRLLRDLSGRRQGWHPFEFDARAGAEAARLAALGLVCLGRWRRRVRLTGAGRALLSLASIDPKIKKARPAAKAVAEMEGEADESLS